MQALEKTKPLPLLAVDRLFPRVSGINCSCTQFIMMWTGVAQRHILKFSLATDPISFSPNPSTRVSPKVKKETGKKTWACFFPLSVVVLWYQASPLTSLFTHVNPSLWFEKDYFRYKNVEIQRKIPKQLISLTLFPPWVQCWICYNIRCESLIKCTGLGKKKHAYVCLTFTTSPIPNLTTIQLKMSNEYVSEPDQKHEVTDASFK